MFKSRRVLRNEYGSGKTGLVIDTAEIAENVFETMAYSMATHMELPGRSVVASFSQEDAEDAHAEMIERFAAEIEKAENTFLPKMKKLIEALKTAKQAAEQVTIEDNGTVNCDAPAISLPYWREDEVRRCVKAVGLDASEWKFLRKKYWVLTVPGNAMGARRTKQAEVMAYSLVLSGYETTVYYQMD